LALTEDQQELLDAIRRVLESDAQIEAAWLAGSLGRGGGDAFSDVDVLALVAEGSAADVGQRYARDVAEIAEPVLVNPLFGGRVVNVVTKDWHRFDMSFIEPEQLARYDAAHLTVLFDRGERSPPRRAAIPYRTTPEAVLPIVNEFLRVLGLSVVVLGRGEYLLLLAGIDLMRRLTIDLMLEENGIGPAERGGALRRNPLLSDDQRRALEALSPVGPDRESLLRANAELAKVFLPRARRLGDEIGMAWPSEFEAATKRHLEKHLGLLID
jgi:predicted nucleotidyltransferase